jgi:hypothetical protein
VLTHPFGVPYREAYVVKVNQLQNAGLPPEAQLKWHLVFEGESIRHLFYSSIDRYLSMPFQKTFGPEKPEEKQP